MTRSASLFLGLAFATLSATTLLQSTTTPDKDDPAPSTQSLRQLVEEQATRLVQVEDELADLRWQTQTLADACVKLGGALKSSRANGFEWAGPNPRAKTDLLEGLMDFSKTIAKSHQPPKKEEEGDDED